MKTETKHYVEFLSPGTLFSERTRKPIESWDCSLACEMVKDVSERYGARPYAFTFTTMLEADPVRTDDGREMKVRPTQIAGTANHFVGGEVLTYDQLVARGESSDRILLGNMRCNGMPLVIENRNSYRSVQEFAAEDCVVDPSSGRVTRRGTDDDLREYRAKQLAEWSAK